MREIRRSTFLPLLLLGLVFFAIATIAINQSGNPFQSNTGISLVGMIWTSGLSEEEKTFYNIDSKYQLTKTDVSPEGWSGKIFGYFLSSTETDLSSYLGKCVSVNGKIRNGWEQLESNNYEINGHGTYYRSALTVSRIEPVDIERCVGDFGLRVKDPQLLKQLEYIKAKGVLSFTSNRPAPDINYDLEIKLSEPFTDELDSSGNPVLMDRLDISPETDEIYIEILKNIGKKVEVEGTMEWGYSESRYLSVSKLRVL